MKAIAVFPKARQVRLIDFPQPKLENPRHVLVQVIRVGLCGTDREIMHWEYGTPPPGSEYLVLGHESLGRVLAVGKEVTKVAAGDLVVATVRRACPQKCLSCGYNESDMCFTGNFVERGIKEFHGYMTEQYVDHEDYIARLPSELEEIGVLLEPLTISEKALKQILLVQSRLHWECSLKDKDYSNLHCRNALVLGGGPVGILGALALRAEKIKTWIVSLEPEDDPRVKLIRSMGIGYFSSKQCTPQDIAKQLGNVDVILEATGSSHLSFQYLPALGTNGICVLTGVPALKKGFVIDEDFIMRNMVLRNQLLLGTVNANITAFQAGVKHLLDFKREFPDQMKKLITHRYPMEQYDQAINDNDPGRIKVTLEISPGR